MNLKTFIRIKFKEGTEAGEQIASKTFYKKTKNIVLLTIVLIFIIGCVVNVFKSRRFNDILYYPLFLIVPLTAIASALLLKKWRDMKFRKLTGDDKATVFSVIVTIILVGFLYYSIGATIKDIINWLPTITFSPNKWSIISIVFTTALIGIILFYFRLRLRSIYGFTEVLVGLSVAGIKFQILPSASDISYFIAYLTAAIYLVVRGLDNIHQGLIKSPVDPIADKLRNFFISLPQSPFLISEEEYYKRKHKEETQIKESDNTSVR